MKPEAIQKLNEVKEEFKLDLFRPDIVGIVIDSIQQAESWESAARQAGVEVDVGSLKTFTFNFGRAAGHTHAVAELVSEYNQDEEGSAWSITNGSTVSGQLNIAAKDETREDVKYLFIDNAGQNTQLDVDILLQTFPNLKFEVYLG
ncbi:hypothetical protein [Ralstonia phage RSP15]|uniref:hypothetical protein n=1 Tax=Ralstonia phage RSP15 TaxID=1785960 RepID=UPI00074D4B4D|nr:hypothetical protein BH754_gp171 [Ralstonia phage RSP15]BAU40135.1 hypothetical protein [Ralstonia phage RSP15]